MAFQEKAWSDEKVMRGWINDQWKPACDGNMLLVIDVHKAQKTPDISHRFEQSNTNVVYIPPGTTSLIQPLHVVFNAPFKAAVGRLATQHVQDNLDAYVQGSIPATDRRVLFTKWVAQAWEEVSSNKDAIVRSFKKCGISLAIDGSQDSEINIRELSAYNVEDSEDETSTDKDPFEDFMDEMSTDVDPFED